MYCDLSCFFIYSVSSNKQSIDVNAEKYCLSHSFCITIPLVIFYLTVFSRTPLGLFLALVTDLREY